jgi:peptidoglycan/LPS O-acetylase OafA/YrhL
MIADGGERVRAHGGDREFYPLFDYLRIALAVGVFAAHADRLHMLPGQLGNACVQVFFALSGFLIGGILVEASPSSLPRFYFNRCTRIWIPYAVAIVLLFTAAALRQRLSDLKLWEFFFYKATFVYNVFGPPQLAACGSRMPLQGTGNHFWSICVEEQFYLVAPFVVVFLRRGRVPVLLGLLALNFVYPHNFNAISLGVLLALSRRKIGEWYLRPLGQLLAIGTLAAALIVVNVGWVSYATGVAPAAAATVALLARPGKPGPLGAVLGGMSYPFYLDHWIGIFIVQPLERRAHLGLLPGALLALTVAIGLSWLHYRWIDSRILGKRSRWYTSGRGLLACLAGLTLVALGLVVGIALRLHPIG